MFNNHGQHDNWGGYGCYEALMRASTMQQQMHANRLFEFMERNNAPSNNAYYEALRQQEIVDRAEAEKERERKKRIQLLLLL